MDITRKIYLIGFMGVGKSKVGALLAECLGLPLWDTDTEFANQHGGMTTGDYISTYGMTHFRPEEEETLRRISVRSAAAVIATGGGVPTYGNNLGIMRDSGFVVHLSAPLDVIASRMTPGELAKRPVWANSSPDALRRLYDERLGIYNRAHLTVDANRPPEDIVQEIIQFNH